MSDNKITNKKFWHSANESPDYFTELLFYAKQKSNDIMSIRIKKFPMGIKWEHFKNIYEILDCVKIIAWAYLRDLPDVPKGLNHER